MVWLVGCDQLSHALHSYALVTFVSFLFTLKLQLRLLQPSSRPVEMLLAKSFARKNSFVNLSYALISWFCFQVNCWIKCCIRQTRAFFTWCHVCAPSGVRCLGAICCVVNAVAVIRWAAYCLSVSAPVKRALTRSLNRVDNFCCRISLDESVQPIGMLRIPSLLTLRIIR